MFDGDVSVTSKVIAPKIVNIFRCTEIRVAQICAATTQTYAKFRDFAEPYLR